MAKLETRNKILKAAEKLFSKNGFDGVATKIIAHEAGVTEMTLFNHFKNKELLYKTVVKERFLKLDFESIISDVTYDDLENDLKKISAAMIELFISNKNILLMRLKEKQNFINDPKFTLEHDPMFEQLKPFFKIYEKTGAIDRSGESAALLFVSCVKGLHYVSFIEEKSDEFINSIVSDFVTTICSGMISNKS